MKVCIKTFSLRRNKNYITGAVNGACYFFAFQRPANPVYKNPLIVKNIIWVNILNSYWKSNEESLMYKNEISKSEKITVEGLKKYLGENGDIIFHNFSFGGTGAFICCVDGLVNEGTLDENILAPYHRIDAFMHCTSQKKALELIEKGFINHGGVKIVDNLKMLVEDILNANFSLVFEDENKAVIYDVKGFEKRSIEESENEGVVKGSKDAFSEPIRINTAILRRHIRSHNLIIKQLQLGDVAKTTVAIAYMKNMAEPELIREIENRLKKMKIQSVVSAGQIEYALDGERSSIFPKVLYTERADKLAANIMNGRAGVLIDGFPVTYICPSPMAMFMQTPEDYSDKSLYSSVIRVIRYLCLLLSVLTPALYIAIVNYDCEIIPAKLALSIMEAKLGVPFTPFVEVFAMLVAFEVLIEAGLRLPKGIGQTVSIVAGLIIGESAINAGLVSPAVVMVTAVSGITSFVVPYQDFMKPIRIVRIILMISGQLAGLFGVSIELIMFLVYLNSFESFSVPYLAPFSAGKIRDWFKDTFIRRRYKK